jgi:hypothetical protein
VKGKYDDPISKISLTVSVGQAAKTQMVKEFGIGEELALNVLGWRDHNLVCVAQMDTSWPSDEEERIMRTGDAYMVMRRGWACDSFTVLAEGYVSSEPKETKNMDLIEAFLDKTKPVAECLTVNYVDAEYITLCAVPFKMGVGRKVTWGPLVHSEDVDVLRNSDYITAAQEVLSQELLDMPQDTETFHLALAIGLHDSSGFFIQYDL